jgi:hypothetical protein
MSSTAPLHLRRRPQHVPVDEAALKPMSISWINCWEARAGRLHADLAIDYVTNLCYTRFVSSLMRGVSGDDPAGGARRGVLRLAARIRSAGGPGPRPPGLTARQRANCWSAPVPLPETAARVPGRKSPRWSAERASRLQRDGPCLASAADRASQARWKRRVRLSALHRPLAGVGANMKDATRTPKGAAGNERCGSK